LTEAAFWLSIQNVRAANCNKGVTASSVLEKRNAWRTPEIGELSEGVEELYQLVDVDRLIADFMADVMRVTGARE